MNKNARAYVDYIEVDDNDGKKILFSVQTPASPPAHRDCVFVDGVQYYVSHVTHHVDSPVIIRENYRITWKVYLKRV